MQILVTGIAGFVGSHLAERLLERGHTVTGIDNFDAFYARSIKEKNLAALAGRARFIEGDILDAALIDRILGEQRYDAIIHLAALAGVGPSLKSPARYQRINVEGTAVLADACTRNGVPSLVFASSSSVYGQNPKIPFEETDRADDPMSPYAASKRAAELVLRSAELTTGLGVTCLRYFTVYGPRQRPDMAIHKFCRAIDRGEPIRITGGAQSSRDYTYVSDIVEGTVLAVESAGPGFRVYNLGGERATTLGDLVSLIARAIGKEPILAEAPAANGDVPHTLASVALAQRELGYRPAVSIEEGLDRFVAWYREQG
ncbi:MAG: NAD-dependent epimerase/dehydratase family protein [Byssovorax sp.]